jgi:hypothetical protein
MLSFPVVAANLTQSSLLRELCALRVEIYLQPGPALSRHRAPKSRRIRTFTKSASNPRGMRSFKTQDLNSFRMRSFKKTGAGRGAPSPYPMRPDVHPRAPVYPEPWARGNLFLLAYLLRDPWIPGGWGTQRKSADSLLRYVLTSLFLCLNCVGY